MKLGYKIILGIVLVIILIVILDMVYIIKFDHPLFSQKRKTDCSLCEVYDGLFYNTVNCHPNKKKIMFKWQKFTCPHYSKYFEIIDESENCAEVLEEIYADKEYVYYLPCLKSSKIKIKFSNGDTYKLKEVLDKELVSIEDLLNSDLGLIKKSKEEVEAKRTMELVINDITYNVNLENNETTKELLNLLPLEIEMQELNGNEKYYYLDNKLKVHAEEVRTIEKGDLMLYGDDCLVLFYKSFNTSYKYTKIGHVDNLEDFDLNNIKVLIK